MIVEHKSPYGETYRLSVQMSKYGNGQNAIKLFDMADGFPYATASICVSDSLLKEDEIAIKDYSENAGILDSLINAGVIEEPHAYIQSGHVMVPICKLISK